MAPTLRRRPHPGLQALLTLLLLGGIAQPATAAEVCPPARTSEALDPAGSTAADHRHAPAPLPSLPGRPDYRHVLRPTPLGWPRRDHWCVWVEPGAQEGPMALWDGRWRQAVDGALASWAEMVELTTVVEPDHAQIRIRRRRPPLRGGRASHGRAELSLQRVDRGQGPNLEPQVVVSISPGQRQLAMQATALHELGHALGLWGHSEDPGDALAARPGPDPVVVLTPRDRATFLWLQQQPGLQEPAGTPEPATAGPGSR